MSEKLLAVSIDETRDILEMVVRRIWIGDRCLGIGLGIVPMAM